MPVKIVQKEDPILRQIAKPVPDSMFGTKKLGKIIEDMKAGIKSQDDAVAIAAPQIGVSLRIFVISGKVFDLLGEKPEGSPESEDIVFINPEIIKLSKDTKEFEEGCLSVRYLYGKIIRSKKARVRAKDQKGRSFEMGASGLLAQIFQHENDHLEGKLFIDNARDLEDLPPEKINGKTNKN